MQQEIMTQSELYVIGIKTRTHYQNELNPVSSKIAPLVQRYWLENIANQIPNRIQPGVTYVAYSNYESDEYGAYDYLMGESVAENTIVPEGFTLIKVPSGKYLKITSQSGPTPFIIIQTWQAIWAATLAKQLLGKRTYKTDFEIYDERTKNPQEMIFDVCLGIE